MSHISLVESDAVDQQITNIAALKAAVVRCGMEFADDQHSFRTWATDHGTLVGDWPLPAGYKSIHEVESTCRHAIKLPAATRQSSGTQSYEIGVIESKKHSGTYSLAYDFYGGAVDALAGKQLSKLMMYYHMEAAKVEAYNRGYVYEETKVGEGQYDVRIDTTAVVGV